MTAWLLFIIGTLAYFLIRYIGRTDKTKSFDFGFWLKDNWAELGVSLLLDLAVMIILMQSDTDITTWLNKYLPEGVTVSAKLVVSLACGLGLGATIYAIFSKKVKDATDK
jgi:hypothetical protein